jgi:hypothetical protein
LGASRDCLPVLGRECIKINDPGPFKRASFILVIYNHVSEERFA